MHDKGNRMTKYDYKQNAYYLMYLIRCVLNDRIPAKEKLDKMNLSGIFAVAKAHSLTAIAAYALESAGIYNKEFEEEKNKAIRKEIILDAERERVLAELEKASIWYMPLKGIVIKDLYPLIGMRQMADQDILFDKKSSEKVRHIMKNLGFSTKLYDGSNHDIYHKPPVCNFEMHTELFPKTFDMNLFDYFSGIKNRLVKDKSKYYCYQLNKEDFYLFLVAHNYKHYSISGTGLRTIVDTYLYNKRYKGVVDMKYVESECVKLGIAQFERQLRELSMHLIGGYKLTAEERQLFDYIVLSGTYGTIQNKVNNEIANCKHNCFSSIRYIVTRLQVPISRKNPQYRSVSACYPWFYKNKLRISLFFFYRIGKALTSKRTLSKVELKTVFNSR